MHGLLSKLRFLTNKFLEIIKQKISRMVTFHNKISISAPSFCTKYLAKLGLLPEVSDVMNYTDKLLLNHQQVVHGVLHGDR